MRSMQRKRNPPATWLLLRGLGRETRHWGHFATTLAQAGFLVRMLDLPGMGSERDRHSLPSIEAITDDIRGRWLKERGHAQDARSAGLLAVSLGGMVALDWAARYPEDFQRAVIINTSSSLNPFYQRMRPAALLDLLSTMLKSKRQAQEGIHARVCNSDAKREETLRLWARIEESAPLKTGELLRQVIAAARFRPPQHIQIPLLFLASSRDRLVDPECSRSLARLYSAPLLMHPWGGHDLPLDDADWIVGRVQAFCRTQPAHDVS